MQLFHEIPEGVVILRSRGVFRQAKVYRRAEFIYAQFGSGFIRLLSAAGTSVPNVSWLDLSAEDVKIAPSGSPRWVGPGSSEFEYALRGAARGPA